jgi:ankyrin repeat protein
MELNHGLYDAAARGDVAALRELVAAGADVNHQRSGRLCLSAAAYNGRTAAVEFLLASGADVDASPGDRVGWTALHAAAAIGHVEIMGLLLAAGADVHIMDVHGRPPLYSSIGASANHARGAKLLLLHGARVTDLAGLDWPLYLAIEYGQRDLVKTFLRAGAEIPKNLPPRTHRVKKVAAILDLMAAIRSAGGWPEYVAKHRRVLASFVSKLSAKSVVPLDAASHLVAFWCPPGGY